MKEELKLEDRTVDNTHPVELRRLHNENFNKIINKLEKRKEFSIVNFIFFLVVSVTFYFWPIIFDVVISVVPLIISIIFLLSTIILKFLIKDVVLDQKISNSLLNYYQSK